MACSATVNSSICLGYCNMALWHSTVVQTLTPCALVEMATEMYLLKLKALRDGLIVPVFTWLDDLPREAGQSMEFWLSLLYAYFSDVIILCVEGRLSPVVASHLKFEFASPQPHASRNLGDFNVETYAKYFRAPVWNPVKIQWKLNEYIVYNRQTDTIRCI
jgi:hypothetical protein